MPTCGIAPARSRCTACDTIAVPLPTPITPAAVRRPSPMSSSSSLLFDTDAATAVAADATVAAGIWCAAGPAMSDADALVDDDDAVDDELTRSACTCCCGW